MKKVPSVYTHLMETIYLSMSTQVAEGTAFRKLPVVNFKNISHKFCTLLLSTADYVRINKNERLVDPPPHIFLWSMSLIITFFLRAPLYNIGNED